MTYTRFWPKSCKNGPSDDKKSVNPDQQARWCVYWSRYSLSDTWFLNSLVNLCKKYKKLSSNFWDRRGFVEHQCNIFGTSERTVSNNIFLNFHRLQFCTFCIEQDRRSNVKRRLSKRIYHDQHPEYTTWEQLLAMICNFWKRPKVPFRITLVIKILVICWKVHALTLLHLYFDECFLYKQLGAYLPLGSLVELKNTSFIVLEMRRYNMNLYVIYVLLFLLGQT